MVGRDDIYLSTVQFVHDNLVYTSHVDVPAQYAIADIDCNFSPVEIDENPRKSDKPSVDISKEEMYADALYSNVNVNIPQTTIKSNNTFVLIIANENYASEKRVDFALNDGRTFKEY